MVPVMSRFFATLVLLGGLGAGIGCQHIGGKADCGYNPADYPIQGPTQPYPTFAPNSLAKPGEPMPAPKGN